MAGLRVSLRRVLFPEQLYNLISGAVLTGPSLNQHSKLSLYQSRDPVWTDIGKVLSADWKRLFKDWLQFLG